MPGISIHGYSTLEIAELQPRIARLVLKCGGWILHEKLDSFNKYSVQFEAGLDRFSEIYAALQQSGMQFTPASHRAMTQMCSCQRHLTDVEELQIVTIDLHVTTLQEENVRIRRVLRHRPV